MNGDIEKLKELLKSNKKVVAQVAPAVRVSLGEEFGAEPGTEITGKVVSALKKLGFDFVFDTCFGADIVALEEAHELKERLDANGPFPLFTSCCIGWKLHALKHFPEKMDALSTSMAPQITLGALAKTYFAKLTDVPNDQISVVSIMPCISKKIEAKMEAEVGIEEVNLVLTTREIAELLKEKKINPLELKDSNFDMFLGHASRGGRKFGATGGVAEAVINTLYRMYGDDETTVKIEDNEPIGYYNLDICGKEVNVIRLYGLANFLTVLKKVEEDNKNPNKKTYHLIEIMTCPFGCVGGPGQPLPVDMEKTKKRAKALREYANKQQYTDPFSNPDVHRVYEKFLTRVGSPKAKELLHIGCELCKFELKKLEEKQKKG